MRMTLLLLSFLFALSSCARLEDFTINRNIFDYIGGYKMNGIYNVDVIGGHSIKLMDTARVSLSKFDITNHISTFYVKKIRGEGVKFYFRTNVWDFEKNKGISFELKDNELCIYDDDELIFVSADYYLDDEYRKIKVLNHGKNVKIWIDCAEIYIVETMKPCTEHIIIESIGATEALLTRMDIELSTGYSVESEFQ